jgi:hypothetical protein
MIRRIVSRSQKGLNEGEDEAGQLGLKILKTPDLFGREPLGNSIDPSVNDKWCRFVRGCHYNYPCPEKKSVEKDSFQGLKNLPSKSELNLSLYV